MSSPFPTARARLLVAEDSPTQAQRLQYLLEQQGHEVFVAPDGVAALEMARRVRPTLVISDVVMPEMDGYELSYRVKNDPLLRGVPVMLVTALSDPHDVIRGLEAGADSFIVKPFEEHYLASRVEFLLANRDMAVPGEAGTGLAIRFKGEKHIITASRAQVLNLLLSTYEAAVERNRELARAQAEVESVNVQLQGALRELEAFSHSVSHDLRAPVHKIHGFGQLLLEDHAPQLDENGRHYVERMIAGARKMDELIEAMLALSKVTRADLVPVEVDLSEMAARVFEEVREREPARRCALRVQPGMHARADARLLEIALTNLLANAWKFTSGREVARIEVGRLDAEADAFFVRDNGAGFDARYAHKLFNAFQRMHSEREFPGTGIGLATVRRVVERHGGRAWAEGRPGEGATFFFSLPRNAPD